MPVKMEVVRSVPDGGVLLRISGVLDDSFDRAEFVKLARGVVVLDLDGLKRVTSLGVREWIRAMEEVRAHYLAFVNCRPAVVTQFNTVSNFGDVGEVLSIYAPYVTEDGEEFEILIDLVKDYRVAKEVRAPAAMSPTTGNPGELDDNPSAYFSYVATRAPPRPPALASWLIGGESGGAGEACRVRKEVTDQLTVLWLSGAIDNRARFRRVADGLEGMVLLMLGDVTAVSAEGIEHLTKLMTLEGTGQVYVARAPVHLLEPIATAVKKAKATLVTVLAEGRTDDGIEMGRIEIDHRTVEGTSAVRKASTAPQLTPESVTAAKALLQPPPAAVASYLIAKADSTGTDVEAIQVDVGTFSGKYEILETLGSGGMAQIFRARQHGAGGFEKIVALKRILPNLALSQDFVAMFLDEARIAAKIHHPNIVDIYELEQEGGTYSIVMEYVQGVDLRSAMKRARRTRQPMPLAYAIAIMRDVCAGLHAAHSAHDQQDGKPLAIIHRDVTPRNVLLSTAGLAKLTDFGIAKAALSASLTAPGAVRGKVPYLAPEQLLRGHDGIDGRADIFSAGVCLFEAIAGVHPFQAATDFAAMQAILSATRPSVRALRPECPPALEQVVLRSLERNREARYSNAGEMRQALDDILPTVNPNLTREEIGKWVASMFADREKPGLAAESLQPPAPTTTETTQRSTPEELPTEQVRGKTR